MVGQARAELHASAIPETTTIVDGYSATVYQLDANSQITFGVPIATPPSGARENISGGLNDGHGHPFITLNTYDQDSIINGTCWAIGFGICAISARLHARSPGLSSPSGPNGSLQIVATAQADVSSYCRSSEANLPTLNYFAQIRCVQPTIRGSYAGDRICCRLPMLQIEVLL